jgi:hypothetical protein
LGSDNTDGLKAVLILTSSYNSNEMGLAHKKDWRQYAEKENLSLLSVHLNPHPQTILIQTHREEVEPPCLRR